MADGDDETVGGLGCCTVCLTPLLGGDDALATTPCGHMYHYRCIVQSLEYKKACPNCCQAVQEGGLHKLAGCYTGKVAAGGDGDGGGADAHVTAEVKKQLASMKSHAVFLAKEVKRLGAVEAAVRDDNLKLRKKYRALQEQEAVVKHKMAKEWEEMAQWRRKCKQLEDELKANQYRDRMAAAADGSHGVAADILSADDGVKNIYIGDMHRLLDDEKARRKKLEATNEALQEMNTKLEEKAARYKEYKEKFREMHAAEKRKAGAARKGAADAATKVNHGPGGDDAMVSRKRSRAELDNGDGYDDVLELVDTPHATERPAVRAKPTTPAALPAHVQRAAERLQATQLPDTLHILPEPTRPPALAAMPTMSRVVRRKSSFADDAGDARAARAEHRALVDVALQSQPPRTPVVQAKLGQRKLKVAL